MYNIAFFLGELELDTQRKILEGIADAAKADRNNIVVYALTLSSDEDYNEGESASMLYDDFSVYDGFIIYAESIYSEKIRNVVIDKIRAQGKPSASIDFFIDGMINVSSDNEGAMRILSKHLIEKHGIKTVNFIGGPEDSIDAVTRKRVFTEELKRVGLKFDKQRFYEGDYYARSGRAAVKYFQSKGLMEADAYVCANDQMALGAYYALTDRGIRIPEDTILSGYDNIFEAANHYPRITTVNRFEEKIGETAYKNVILAIEGKEFISNPVIDSEPVYAETCGCDAIRPVNHRLVVNQYSRNKLREARYAEMINDLTVNLTNAQSMDDVISTTTPCIPELGGDAFILAIFDNNEKDADKLQSPADILSYDNGAFKVLKNVNISITERHPRFDDNPGGNLFIIYSLHYRKRFYGFTSIRNSSMPLFSEFYKMFMMALSSALDQVWNVIKMQKMIKTLDEMWVFDPMTHVYNRAGFFKFSEKILEEARKVKEDMFFIFLDLDGLKKVNDAMGHETGDRMICDMADILRKNRNKEELLMRYGGDEFVVFGKGLSEKEVKTYVDRIRKAMAELNLTGNREYRIDASIGHNMVPYDNDKPLSALIELADQEMYKEKRKKHNSTGVSEK
ncbi:MAG: GGDEF domain-containing protein [Lachnospiraceae bacterium]|nr:GGDEF domain-containing protein [Lachnospiraceae bacterium]